MRRAFLAAIPALAWVLPALAQQAPPIAFRLPVDCDMERICSVQIYVDNNPGPGISDHACGRLTYDGSNGTDFRVRNLADMERGVTVVAAAGGVVVGTRDGMADVSVDEIGLEALGGKDAGNGVGIDHGNGWFAQYSHLKRGSVRVRTGDRVSAGTPLGLIGLSGRTNFPHVDFEVRHQGQRVDPFVGTGISFACDGPRAPLWTPEALAQLDYRPAWLLNAGFAAEAAQADKIRRGDYLQEGIGTDSPALTYWVNFANALADDRYELVLSDPDGIRLSDVAQFIDKPKRVYYAFAGRRRPDDGWRAGTYRGEFRLFRDGRQILSDTREITLR